MRLQHIITALFLASSLFATAAKAADTSKLEAINVLPASTQKKCPVPHDTKEYEHKEGEPCPYHHDEVHHGESQEKCDHKHPN